jgi:hypothetical protein
VEVAERYADGLATKTELVAARDVAGDLALRSTQLGTVAYGLADAARVACLMDVAPHAGHWRDFDRSLPPARQAALLRCIIGNPFRAVTLTEFDGRPALRVQDPYHSKPGVHASNVQTATVYSADLLTPTVVNLAQTIYDDRAFGLLPVLADALEEAGCPVMVERQECPGRGGLYPAGGFCRTCNSTGRVPNPLLAHCRGPGVHTRGCHVVDALLGKE